MFIRSPVGRVPRGPGPPWVPRGGHYVEYRVAYVENPVAYFEYPVAYFEYPVAYFDILLYIGYIGYIVFLIKHLKLQTRR